MKIRILKIIIPLLIIAFAIAHSGGLNIFNKDITVRAVGDLNVIWGVPDGDPIFVVSNASGAEKKHAYLSLGVDKYYAKVDYRLDQLVKDIQGFLAEKKE